MLTTVAFVLYMLHILAIPPLKVLKISGLYLSYVM